jgi:hypothetical protein
MSETPHELEVHSLRATISDWACALETFRVRYRELEKRAELAEKNVSFWMERAERAEQRVAELERLLAQKGSNA